MKTVPVPYFTYKELRKPLRNLGYDTEVITRMCKMYQEHVCDHPDSFYHSGPRTLYHLAHCKVRECLSEAFEFPFGIEKLDLVESCKESLRLTAYKAAARPDSEAEFAY
ncbi:hypothetical protein TNIN_256411 [Trichonephila inaurata madagascariensis]|uniref:Uncharacterized protein n=1 Tax=Trichonephila inaurata madagascariensis TaxID=2747483 RepID=A0A8X6XRV1_9ARAC|nr:hypothetical protein TNIN_70901 [Trichonephila inaurata madagascariensis]GFY73551.1 hypothetical protein TNIN_256411 [Trichonephila inaurata madagascariensis]